MYILCPQKENGIGSDKWPNLFQLYMSKQERTSTISNDKDHKTTLVFSVSDLKLFLYNMNHTEAKYFLPRMIILANEDIYEILNEQNLDKDCSLE